jgi:formylglycine-generating enzyme
MSETARDGGAITIIGDLPRELTRLFMTPTEIRRIVTDAGLNPGLFYIDGLPPLIAWTSILLMAEDGPGIRAIIETAQRDFRDNEVLARAMQDDSAGRLPFSQPNSSIRVDINAADLSISAGTAVFRYIPPGTAWVGSDDGYEHERPRHKVRQSAFFLQDAPVTCAEFEAFCDTTGFRSSAELGSAALYISDGVWRPVADATWRHPTGDTASPPVGDHHPVVQVSWYDASIYCRWFAEVTGLAVGLPTETQWEYAAGGPAGLRWPSGDTYEPGMANVEHMGTTPVRSFTPNAFGLYDMAGNAQQWCADWYTPEWARAGHVLSGVPSLDPAGPGSGDHKVLRGGSWFDVPYHCRTANRFYAAPILAAANWGFRPCLPMNDKLIRMLISDPGWNLRAEDMLGGV